MGRERFGDWDELNSLPSVARDSLDSQLMGMNSWS